jgi:hypothetical protein
MPDLTPAQLESLRRLLIDPLRETIKQELQINHDRLTSAIEKLADRLTTHAQSAEKRVATVEREIARQRTFRRRLVAVYGVMALLLSVVWSFLRDRLLSKLYGR